MDDNNRIVLNTIVKYSELLINIVLGVLIIRYILQSLGSEDYGIYMVVAGVIAMFGVLSTSMSSTAMRFIGNSLGKTDQETAKKTFNTSFVIHLFLGLLLIALLELGGWMMFEWVLNIPDEKIVDAKIVYQFMIASAFFTILVVPYDAIINAHENLLFLSLTSIFQQALKLLLALFLLHSSGNRLVEYGLFMACISFIIMLFRLFYCKTHYLESKLSPKNSFDIILAKSMFSFTGWELFSTLSALATTQLRGLLINMFFGVRLNAGEGIAKSVNAYTNNVSVGITNAITPQMNKCEGAGNRKRLMRLTNVGVKFTSFMFSIVALPILLEIPFILRVWLKDVPEFAAIFCQLCIIIQLISKLTWQIGNAIRAVGKIKYYRLVCGILSLFGVIVAYLVFKIGGTPTSIFYVEIVICLITGVVTLHFGKRIVGIQPRQFFIETTLPVILPFLVSVVLGVIIQYFMVTGWIRLFTVCAVSMLSYMILFWLFGVRKEEKEILTNVIESASNRIKNH